MKLTKTLDVMRLGRITVKCINKNVLIVKRALLNEVVHILLNLSRARVNVDLNMLRIRHSKPCRNLIDMSKVKSTVKLNPKSGAIIKYL